MLTGRLSGGSVVMSRSAQQRSGRRSAARSRRSSAAWWSCRSPDGPSREKNSPGPDVQRHAVDRPDVAEALLQVDEADLGRGGVVRGGHRTASLRAAGGTRCRASRPPQLGRSAGSGHGVDLKPGDAVLKSPGPQIKTPRGAASRVPSMARDGRPPTMHPRDPTHGSTRKGRCDEPPAPRTPGRRSQRRHPAPGSRRSHGQDCRSGDADTRPACPATRSPALDHSTGRARSPGLCVVRTNRRAERTHLPEACLSSMP